MVAHCKEVNSATQIVKETMKTMTMGRCWMVTTEQRVFTPSSNFYTMFQSDKLSDANVTLLVIQHKSTCDYCDDTRRSIFRLATQACGINAHLE